MKGFSPARRLHRTLSLALEKETNWSAAQVFCTVFGADHSTRADTYEIFAELYRLVEQARRHVQANPDLNQDLYRGPIEDVFRVLNSVQVDLPWQEFANQLSGAVMRSLEFCAEKMDELTDEAEISFDALAELKKSVEELIDELVASTMDISLRDALLLRLEEIRTVLQRYLLYGVDGLNQATENAIGTAVIKNPSTKSSPETKGNFDRFVSYCKKVGEVTSAAKKLYDLIEPAIQKYLLGTSSNV